MGETKQHKCNARTVKLDKTLAALVDELVAKVVAAYPVRIRRRPAALKKQVLSLVRHRLPPYPKKSGPRPRTYITEATNAYRKQKREIREGRLREANWNLIALDHLPGYRRIRSDHHRKVVLKRLREAVYAHLNRRRKRAKKT